MRIEVNKCPTNYSAQIDLARAVVEEKAHFQDRPMPTANAQVHTKFGTGRSRRCSVRTSKPQRFVKGNKCPNLNLGRHSAQIALTPVHVNQFNPRLFCLHRTLSTRPRAKF